MCQICDDTLYVCENHKDRPWDGNSDRADACGCGAGMPCECWTPEKERERMASIIDNGQMICSVWDK